MSKSIFIVIALFSVVGTTYASTIDNCTSIDSCEDCNEANCSWISCEAYPPSCQKNGPTVPCNEIPCVQINTTLAPPTVQPTTKVPTTEAPTEVPTTEVPTTEVPTTEIPTTEVPTTEVPTTEVPTTEVPTTEAPTEIPTTEAPTEIPTTEPVTPPTTVIPTTTAKPPTPSGRHFDAASFFGGMVLAVGIMAVAYAAWRFYKSRNGRSYHTL